MTTLLWIAIKATLLLGAGWVTVTAMRKAAAATRHRVCMLALGGACLLPLFELAGPRWEAAPASALITAVVAGTAASSSSVHWWNSLRSPKVIHPRAIRLTTSPVRPNRTYSTSNPFAGVVRR